MNPASLIPRCKTCVAPIRQKPDGRWYIVADYAERPAHACGAGEHEPTLAWCDYCHDETPQRRESKGKDAGWRWRCIPCERGRLGRKIEAKRRRRVAP